MVVVDFLHCRLAPLRARVCPAWFYTSVDDMTRTQRRVGTNLTEVEILELLVLIEEVWDPVTGILPGGVMPLCEDQGHHAFLATLPKTDTRRFDVLRARPSGSIHIEGGVSGSSWAVAPKGEGKRRRPRSPVPTSSSSSSSLPPLSPLQALPALGQRTSSTMVGRPAGASTSHPPLPGQGRL